MTSDLLALIEYYEKEKGIDRRTMVDALEGALLSASKRKIGPARDLRVRINPDKGTIKAYASLIVVEEVEDPWEEIPLATARRIKKDVEIGGEVDVDVTPKNFDLGRIAVQTAKQAMMTRLRQAEKEMMYEEYKDRAGDVVSGTVRRFEKSDVYVDLGKFDGVMPSRERVSTEDYNVGDRLRVYVVAVENGARGPEIILSRSHPNFVRRLFEFEVSEIADRTVELRAIAREAGYRTKVAVSSTDEKVDPVGACVGLRGARVKNIVRELNNEKVDIIRWSEDLTEFVKDALKPAEIRTVTVNEEAHSIRVTVPEEELSKAIGRRGQNARLTSRLMGWDVQVEKDESEHERFEARMGEAAGMLSEQLSVDAETAEKLVQGGMLNVEAMVWADSEDIAGILGIEEDEAAAILGRARALFSGEGTEEGETVSEVDAENADTDAAAVPAADAESTESAETGKEEEGEPATS